MKKYTLLGNNLVMEMAENKYRLKIIGDNNYIHIHRNDGSVIMIGDNCGIDVSVNNGMVQMIGCSAAKMDTGGRYAVGSSVGESATGASELKKVCDKDLSNKVVQKDRKKRSFKLMFYKILRATLYSRIKRTLNPGV